MNQIIKGEKIVRAEPKSKKKRVRRRKKILEEAPANTKGKQTIITKPATS